jgi:hypothetical protein
MRGDERHSNGKDSDYQKNDTDSLPCLSSSDVGSPIAKMSANATFYLLLPPLVLKKRAQAPAHASHPRL